MRMLLAVLCIVLAATRCAVAAPQQQAFERAFTRVQALLQAVRLRPGSAPAMAVVMVDGAREKIDVYGVLNVRTGAPAESITFAICSRTGSRSPIAA